MARNEAGKSRLRLLPCDRQLRRNMSINVRAGAATIDITPPAGPAMSGFGARTTPAVGAHDPLTARAVAVDANAIVCADVVGLHEDSCARIRERCCLPAGNVVVTALHT